MNSMIAGTGSVVPEKVLTNFDLEKMVDTSDQWIRERTGIQERRIAADSTRTSDLAALAAKRAFDSAGVNAEEVDAIICGTVTGDYSFPSLACFVQEKLGAVNAAAFDVQAACSGFIYGLSLADAFISKGQFSTVLVIGAELLSRVTDWEDRATCVLFGDGAGAAVVKRSNGEQGIMGTFLKSDGRLTELLCMPGGGTMLAPKVALEEKQNFIKMKGQEVFKAAVTAMGDATTHILEETNLTGDDIDLLIPHQANIRIIQATARRARVPMEKVYVNVNKYGNTSAASIPIALDEARRNGALSDGGTCMMVAFGAGFTWGACVVRF